MKCLFGIRTYPSRLSQFAACPRNQIVSETLSLKWVCCDFCDKNAFLCTKNNQNNQNTACVEASLNHTLWGWPHTFWGFLTSHLLRAPHVLWGPLTPFDDSSHFRRQLKLTEFSSHLLRPQKSSQLQFFLASCRFLACNNLWRRQPLYPGKGDQD